jgi:hypothetical protein
MAHKNCSRCDGFLQQILEIGIPAVCPQCGLLYSVARGVSNSPKVPQEIKSVAGIVVVGLLFLGAFHLIDRAVKG